MDGRGPPAAEEAQNADGAKKDDDNVNKHRPDCGERELTSDVDMDDAGGKYICYV